MYVMKRIVTVSHTNDPINCLICMLENVDNNNNNSNRGPAYTENGEILMYTALPLQILLFIKRPLSKDPHKNHR